MEGEELNEAEEELVSDPDWEAADERDVEDLEEAEFDIDLDKVQVCIQEVKLALLKVVFPCFLSHSNILTIHSLV